MELIVDEEIVKRHGLTLPEFVLLFASKKVNVSNTLRKLREDGKIYIKNGRIYPEDDVSLLVEKILKSSKKASSKKKTSLSMDELQKLASEMKDLFPKGKKPGTNFYWKGNSKEVVNKLAKFFEIFDDQYSKEDVLEATTRYVESFRIDNTNMRLLPYFIMKQVVRKDDQGNSYQEWVSDLASYIENEDIEEDLSDWTQELI